MPPLLKRIAIGLVVPCLLIDPARATCAYRLDVQKSGVHAGVFSEQAFSNRALEHRASYAASLRSLNLRWISQFLPKNRKDAISIRPAWVAGLLLGSAGMLYALHLNYDNPNRLDMFYLQNEGPWLYIYFGLNPLAKTLFDAIALRAVIPVLELTLAWYLWLTLRNSRDSVIWGLRYAVSIWAGLYIYGRPMSDLFLSRLIYSQTQVSTWMLDGVPFDTVAQGAWAARILTGIILGLESIVAYALARHLAPNPIAPKTMKTEKPEKRKKAARPAVDSFDGLSATPRHPPARPVVRSEPQESPEIAKAASRAINHLVLRELHGHARMLLLQAEGLMNNKEFERAGALLREADGALREMQARQSILQTRQTLLEEVQSQNVRVRTMLQAATKAYGRQQRRTAEAELVTARQLLQLGSWSLARDYIAHLTGPKADAIRQEADRQESKEKQDKEAEAAQVAREQAQEEARQAERAAQEAEQQRSRDLEAARARAEQDRKQKLQALSAKGEEQFRLDKWKEALRTFEDLLHAAQAQDLSERLTAYLGIASITFQLKKTRRASSAMDHAREVALEAAIHPEDRLHALLERAKLLRVLGNKDAAQAQIEELFALSDGDRHDATWTELIHAESRRLHQRPEAEMLREAWAHYHKGEWQLTRRLLENNFGIAAQGLRLLAQTQIENAHRPPLDRLKPVLAAFSDWLCLRWPELSASLGQAKASRTYRWAENLSRILNDNEQLVGLKAQEDLSTKEELRAWLLFTLETVRKAAKTPHQGIHLNASVLRFEQITTRLTGNSSSPGVRGQSGLLAVGVLTVASILPASIWDSIIPLHIGVGADLLLLAAAVMTNAARQPRAEKTPSQMEYELAALKFLNETSADILLRLMEDPRLAHYFIQQRQARGGFETYEDAVAAFVLVRSGFRRFRKHQLESTLLALWKGDYLTDPHLLQWLSRPDWRALVSKRNRQMEIKALLKKAVALKIPYRELAKLIGKSTPLMDKYKNGTITPPLAVIARIGSYLSRVHPKVKDKAKMPKKRAKLARSALKAPPPPAPYKNTLRGSYVDFLINSMNHNSLQKPVTLELITTHALTIAIASGSTVAEVLNALKVIYLYDGEYIGQFNPIPYAWRDFQDLFRRHVILNPVFRQARGRAERVIEQTLEPGWRKILKLSFALPLTPEEDQFEISRYRREITLTDAKDRVYARLDELPPLQMDAHAETRAQSGEPMPAAGKPMIRENSSQAPTLQSDWVITAIAALAVWPEAASLSTMKGMPEWPLWTALAAFISAWVISLRKSPPSPERYFSAAA